MVAVENVPYTLDQIGTTVVWFQETVTYTE